MTGNAIGGPNRELPRAGIPPAERRDGTCKSSTGTPRVWPSGSRYGGDMGGRRRLAASATATLLLGAVAGGACGYVVAKHEADQRVALVSATPGPTGRQGATGAPGPRGPAGPPGATGPVGRADSRGSLAPQGRRVMRGRLSAAGCWCPPPGAARSALFRQRRSQSPRLIPSGVRATCAP